jgi:REP element-mobilizing transposase RayT
MRSPWTQLYLHFTWATWDRHPFLAASIRSRVYQCIQAECGRVGAEVIAIGGIEDHVHLLVRVPATLAPANLAKQVKGASSHLVNHEIARGETFKWQGGYGVFSVSKREVPRIRDYVLRQEQHHREKRLDPELEPTMSESARPSMH